MCGLIGCRSHRELSLASIEHRGPDAAAQVVTGAWRLGHTRLAIQDMSDASSQPYEADGIMLTYNGELWNPEQLREKIGGHWRTSGDTEVVARVLARFGLDALPMLDGMFALAWVDQSGDLNLARDAYGEIPLHYGTADDGTIVYCSEIAPLLEMGVSPASVRWLEPGTVMTVTDGNNVSSRKWYTEPKDDPSASVRELLATGVRNRLVGDAPIAFLLSGGLDSSAVAALAEMPAVTAYTAVHYAKSRDRQCAREIAQRLGMTLVEVPVPVPTADDLRQVVEWIEQPHKAQVEISWACVHLARRLRADGIKVILSGEGSDELLGSYGMAYHGIKQHGFRGYRERVFTGQHRKNFARTNKIFMRFGIEARLPFLHPPLVSHLLSRTQEEVTMAGKHPKAILASAVDDLIGQKVAWRAKAAFQTDARLDKSAARSLSDPAAFYRSEFQSTFRGVKP